MIDDDILDEIGWFGFNQTVFLFDVEEERIYKAGAMLDQVLVTSRVNPKKHLLVEIPPIL